MKFQEPGAQARDLGHRHKVQRSETIRLLRLHKATLVQRYGVSRVAVFGSTARDAAHADSDVDVLVDFDGPATSARYFGVQFYLEDLLSRRV